MVLAQAVGKKRAFVRGLVLTIVTFGIYSVYWNYRAHNEIYRQFELGREDRDEGMVWYVLGLVVPPFLLAYIYVFAGNVAYLRERIGLRRSSTPGRMIAFVAVAAALFVGAIVHLQIALGPLPETATEEEVSAALQDAAPLALLLVVLAAAVLAFAYRRLQRDINEIWDAYAVRMAYLLAPTAAAPAPADPLRAELMALEDRYPNLAVGTEVDALLARAAAGDPTAHAIALVRVRDTASRLQERESLIARMEDVALRRRSASDAGTADVVADLDAVREGMEARLRDLDASLFR